MKSLDGRYTIVFNGEIYNHAELRSELQLLGFKFSSHSDTEVLLAGYAVWKQNIVSKINGPFAFVIFDKLKETIFIARDKVGEKPLFFMEEKDGLVFSSEQKPLIKLSKIPRQFSASSLVSYLSRGYPMQGTSILDGIKSVPPGHYLHFHLQTGDKEIISYWAPSFRGAKKPARLDVQIESLQKLFSDSVKLQLQCDVPACILLSGGVDSSLITAFASEHTKTVKTFTVKFSGFPSFDEADRALLISDYFATSHTEIEGGNPSPDVLETIANSIDSPINDSSLIPTYLVYREISSMCKVALGGDGGDELFGGYKHYSRLIMLNNFIGFVLPLLSKTRANNLKRLIPNYYRSRNWISALSNNLGIYFILE
jgi:asparagine synthase (glutamine-hydrolysing)